MSSKRKKPTPKTDESVEVKEVQEAVEVKEKAPVEEVQITEEVSAPEEVQETPVAVEEPAIAPQEVIVRVSRDAEGRLVLAQEGKPNRIAGSDEAFVEVARQFADALVKERQI